MSEMNNLIDSMLVVLNDSSKLRKPFAPPYTGSFFFGPNQQVSFRNNSPKGKVTGGVSFGDEKSFGAAFTRSKHYNVHVAFFSPARFVGSQSGYRNEELVLEYLDLIEDAVITSLGTGSLGRFSLEEWTVEEDPVHILDDNVYAGRWLFVFKNRCA